MLTRLPPVLEVYDEPTIPKWDVHMYMCIIKSNNVLILSTVITEMKELRWEIITDITTDTDSQHALTDDGDQYEDVTKCV